MKTRACLAVLGMAFALAGCEGHGPPAKPLSVATGAPTPSPAAQACFRTADIRNHTVGGDRTLYLNVGVRGVYRVEMTSACLTGATSSDTINAETASGSMIVCRPADLQIGVRMGQIANRCITESITRVTPTEVAALPPRLRP